MQHTWNLATTNFDVILGEEFCLPPVAGAEGLFATACIIMRPAKQREANKMLKH